MACAAVTSNLKTSFSCFTLLSGYFLVLASSRKARAYASGPAFTWGTTQGPCYFFCCRSVCVFPCEWRMEQTPGRWCCPAVWAADGSCPPQWRSKAAWSRPPSCSSRRWPLRWGSGRSGADTSLRCVSLRRGNNEWLRDRNTLRRRGASTARLAVNHFGCSFYDSCFSVFYSWGLICVPCIFPSSYTTKIRTQVWTFVQ